MTTRLRALRSSALLLPVVLACGLVASGVWLIAGDERVARSADSAIAAESLRADLNRLAAIENGAEAGENTSPEDLDRVMTDIEVHLVETLPSLEDPQRDRFAWQVRTFAAAAVFTIAEFSAGDTVEAELLDEETIDPLYFEISEQIDNVVQSAREDVARSRTQTRQGLAAGLTVAILAISTTVWLNGRSQSNQGRQEGSRRFQALIEDSFDHIYVIEDTGRITFLSPAAQRHLGRPVEDLATLDETVGPAAADAFRQLMNGEGPPEAEFVVDGRSRWFALQAADRLNHPDIGGFVITARDVTEQTALRQELGVLASCDALTGLLNRRAFEREVAGSLSRTGRSPMRTGLLLIDLDGFKGVNDTLGHQVGDHLLKEVSSRLTGAARDGEAVARLGGDEFAIVIETSGHTGDLLASADRIIAAISLPVEIEDQFLSVAASIGVAVADDETDAETLIRYADIALYQAKQAGRRRSIMFAPEMEDLLLLQNRLLNEMVPAFKRGEFSLVFQPLVEVDNGRTAGFEALMRWHSPTLGTVPPLTFIPVAERTGMIGDLGAWAIEEACNQLAGFQQATGDPALTVSVNASVVELEHSDYVQKVAAALESSGIDPACLQIEVTESVIGRDQHQLVEQLDVLRGLGVKIALDDFGTGYSSMSQLGTLPIDCLKIDRQFIAALNDGEDRAKNILLALIELGKALDIDVVAEGVEEQAQFDALQAPGCDLAQGYLLAPPMPPADIPGFVVHRREATVGPMG